jgi:hypothetical protein
MKAQCLDRPMSTWGFALALVSWSFTTLAVAAKNVMTSVPTYMALERDSRWFSLRLLVH